MRYTETSHKIENPADLIRVVSSCIVLSMFRMVNEYSKRVMFLGQDKLKIQFSVALGINGLLLVGEFISKFVIGDRVIVIMESHFIPLIISFVLISLILLVVIKNPDFDIQVSAKSDLNEFESDEVASDRISFDSASSANPDGISSDSANPDEYSANPDGISSDSANPDEYSANPDGILFDPDEYSANPEFSFDSVITSDVNSTSGDLLEETTLQRPLSSKVSYEGFESIKRKVDFADIESNLRKLSGVLVDGNIGDISEVLNDSQYSDEDVLDSIQNEKDVNLEDIRETPQDITRRISQNIQSNHYNMLDDEEDDLFSDEEQFSYAFNQQIDS